MTAFMRVQSELVAKGTRTTVLEPAPISEVNFIIAMRISFVLSYRCWDP